MYDYLIVGIGLFGAVCARELLDRGNSVLMVDKRKHIGGNVYTENINGIDVHKYGAHIFHTNYSNVWQYVNRFVQFNDFVNSPIAKFNGEVYSLPFNMYTFNKMWNISRPIEAKSIINDQVKRKQITAPTNLEEKAISLVGTDVYTKLVKGYTEKQWGRPCSELPAEIITRLPVRFTYDNNYFNAKYQGIPVNGYTELIEKLIDGAEIRLDTCYDKKLRSLAHKMIYTGSIDEYYDYQFGKLEYRSLKFEHFITTAIDNWQGNAVVNYTDSDTPFTRCIEHKWFNPSDTQRGTIVTYEYPINHSENSEPYYPINDEKNNALYNKYRKLAEQEDVIMFGGRLGDYVYYDMDTVILSALDKIANF